MKFWGRSHLSFNGFQRESKGWVFIQGKGNVKEKERRTAVQEKHRANVTTKRISVFGYESGIWCYIKIYQSLFKKNIR